MCYINKHITIYYICIVDNAILYYANLIFCLKTLHTRVV